MADSAPLYEVLEYDPSTGLLTWKPRSISLFNDGKQSAYHNQAIWNGRFAGKPALSCADARGYLTGNLFGRAVKAHRIAWEIFYSHPPRGEIDHINGNRQDNRISNLRDVSHAENGKNLRLKANNTTGITGIRKRPSGRWAATISPGGKNVTLGTFDTLGEAKKAREIGEREYGFHPNHGITR
jgi:hypothetical protein